MASIFISYRRDDAQGFAGRLEDGLAEHFGEASVFRDQDIPAGRDFAAHLRAHLGAADVVLVVIGPRWLEQRDASGTLRLESETDWVRLEVELALARETPVVPVLVGGATMPWPDQLPESLAPLAGRQAISLSDGRWAHDLSVLATQLTRLAPALQRDWRQPNPPARRAEEADAVRARLPAWARRQIASALRLLIALAVLYWLVRSFGGADANRMLDKVVSTLARQWRELLAAVAG